MTKRVNRESLVSRVPTAWSSCTRLLYGVHILYIVPLVPTPGSLYILQYLPVRAYILDRRRLLLLRVILYRVRIEAERRRLVGNLGPSAAHARSVVTDSVPLRLPVVGLGISAVDNGGIFDF